MGTGVGKPITWRGAQRLRAVKQALEYIREEGPGIQLQRGDTGLGIDRPEDRSQGPRGAKQALEYIDLGIEAMA